MGVRQTRQGSPVEIDFVFQLKESFRPPDVHVVGHGGAAERDGFPQYRLDRAVQALQFLAGEPASLTSGTDAGAKQAFIGIDIAHTMEKFLVQQRRLDGGSTAAKERAKVVERNLQRLLSGSDEAIPRGRIPSRRLAWFLRGLGKIEHGEPTKTPGIDKADLATIVELKNGVGMGRQRLIWIADQETARHSKMDNATVPADGILRGSDSCSRGAVWGESSPREIDDNMLAHAADAPDGAAGKGVDDIRGWGTEWLRVGAEPDGNDGPSAHAFVDAVGDVSTSGSSGMV